MLILTIAGGVVLGVVILRVIDELELWPVLFIVGLSLIFAAGVVALGLYWKANPSDFRAAIQVSPLFLIVAAIGYGVYRFENWQERRRRERRVQRQAQSRID